MNDHGHISVLLDEVVDAFADRDLYDFFDGTLGAGGHAAALLSKHPEMKRYLGVDRDPDALEIASRRLLPWRKIFSCERGNFLSVINQSDTLFDGILLDLGVSSMQLDRAEKGFSFSKEGPLDMRMDPSEELSAFIVVNEWTEEELGYIFRAYGEEPQWRRAARAIVEARLAGPIETTAALADLLRAALKRNPKKKVDPVTLIFQAIRIAVNGELAAIEKALPIMIEHLKPYGRLAVISFHSLEDRIVKNVFRFAASDKYDTSGAGGLFLDKEPLVNLVTRKPIIAGDREIAVNPRARSAKLRIVEKR